MATERSVWGNSDEYGAYTINPKKVKSRGTDTTVDVPANQRELSPSEDLPF